MQSPSRHLFLCRATSAEFFKHIGPRQLEEHQAGRRNPVMPPLRNRPRRYVAQFSNRRGSADGVNDLAVIHNRDLSRLRLKLQAI